VSASSLEMHAATSRYASPWGFQQRARMLLWSMVWRLLCGWTPKPLNAWRLLWLRAFGCKTNGRPFIHQRARIQIPWNVTLQDRACVGDRANLYSLGEIELGSGCTVAQEAYLCTGTHDLTRPDQPLVTGKITVGADAFIGARAFVMPGITVGEGAVVGACSVVTRDVQPRFIVAGSPARFLRFKS
jgi:putative colanic acid biosynthesis acetyltransferase WcaF